MVGKLSVGVARHQLMGVGVVSTHFPGHCDADWLWAKHSHTLDDSSQLTLSVFFLGKCSSFCFLDKKCVKFYKGKLYFDKAGQLKTNISGDK